MPTTPIRLLLADVDGTLVTSDKVLTDRAVRAVHKLHDAGVLFAVTSGRPPRGMSMIIEPLALTTELAAFNGGLIVNPDMTVVEQQVIPAEVVAPVVALMESFGLSVWIYRCTGTQSWTVQFTLVPDFDGLEQGTAKVVGVSDDHQVVEAAASAARAQFGDHVSAARSQPYYLDVTHPQANKGGVVESWSAKLQISPDQIATIGDMPNDVLMFAHSGSVHRDGQRKPRGPARGQAGDDEQRGGLRERGRGAVRPMTRGTASPGLAALNLRPGPRRRTVSVEHEKQRAAEAAAELVKDGMTIGLGTGSTVAQPPACAGPPRISLRCVATSPQTEEAALMLDLRVEPFGSIDRFDIAIDGADQITPDGWLVKGGGAAHTREKIVGGRRPLRRDRRLEQASDSAAPAGPARAARIRAGRDHAPAPPGLPARRATQPRRRRHRGPPRCRRRPRGPGGAARRHPRRRRARPVPSDAGRRRIRRPRRLGQAPRSCQVPWMRGCR